MPKLVDLTGQKFGRLTVLRRDGSLRHRVMWWCICDCGKEKRIRAIQLTVGNSKSCGCLKQEQDAQLTKHGHTRRGMISGEWMSWRSMILRCTYPGHKSFPLYGGRGIQICQRWQKFENFLADMGPKPSAQHSIDRINNDGNYEPLNCRWADAKQQRANKRTPKRYKKYNAADDFEKSLLACYAAVCERKAQGGKGWPE